MSADIRAKMTLFISFITPVFLFSSPILQAGLLTILVFSIVQIKVEIKKLFNAFVPLLPLFVLVALLSGFQSIGEFKTPVNNEILFRIGSRLLLRRGGALQAITFLLRIVNTIGATRILLSTAPPEEFHDLCAALKFPSFMTFIITTAVRFIPVLERKMEAISDSQRCRGGGFERNLPARVALMIPLIINSIILAENLSLALLNRGFGLNGKMTDLYRIELKKSDFVIIVFSIVVIILCVYLRVSTDFFLL